MKKKNSFMNSLNNNGPNINPCGIPQVISLVNYTKDQSVLSVSQHVDSR